MFLRNTELEEFFGVSLLVYLVPDGRADEEVEEGEENFCIFSGHLIALLVEIVFVESSCSC